MEWKLVSKTLSTMAVRNPKKSVPRRWNRCKPISRSKRRFITEALFYDVLLRLVVLNFLLSFGLCNSIDPKGKFSFYAFITNNIFFKWCVFFWCFFFFFGGGGGVVFCIKRFCSWRQRHFDYVKQKNGERRRKECIKKQTNPPPPKKKKRVSDANNLWANDTFNRRNVTIDHVIFTCSKLSRSQFWSEFEKASSFNALSTTWEVSGWIVQWQLHH